MDTIENFKFSKRISTLKKGNDNLGATEEFLCLRKSITESRKDLRTIKKIFDIQKFVDSKVVARKRMNMLNFFLFRLFTSIRFDDLLTDIPAIQISL